MNIQSLKDFLLNNCFSKAELYEKFYYAATTTPVDAFTYNHYTVAHLISARKNYLIENKQEDLIPYGILWDLCSLYYGRTKGTTNNETIHELVLELCEWFELEPKTISDFIPILAFDTMVRTGNAEKNFLQAIQEVGNTHIYRIAFMAILKLLNYVGPEFVNERRNRESSS